MTGGAKIVPWASIPTSHPHELSHDQPLATINVLTVLIVAALLVAIVVRALAWTLGFVGQSWPPVDGLLLPG